MWNGQLGAKQKGKLTLQHNRPKINETSELNENSMGGQRPEKAKAGSTILRDSWHLHLNKVGCRYGISPDGSESNQLRVCARKAGALKSVYIASGSQSGRARALRSWREAGISVDRGWEGGRRMLEGNCQLCGVYQIYLCILMLPPACTGPRVRVSVYPAAVTGPCALLFCSAIRLPRVKMRALRPGCPSS